MDYSFVDKSADQIIEDLAANRIDGQNVFEITAAAIQAAVARENRRLQIRLTALSLCLSAVSIVIAIVALTQVP